MELFEDLPEEIRQDILSHIPPERVGMLSREYLAISTQEYFKGLALKNRGYFRSLDLKYPGWRHLVTEAVYLAARMGQLYDIIHMLEFKGEVANINKIAADAAYMGHLDIVKWGLENGASDIPYIASAAGIGGRLELLYWFYENGLRMDYELIAEGAAEGGHLEVLVWALAHFTPPAENIGTLMRIAYRSRKANVFYYLKKIYV